MTCLTNEAMLFVDIAVVVRHERRRRDRQRGQANQQNQPPQCRLSPRWLVLLVGLAALAITTAALVPHDDGNIEEQHCLVCKAGHQPLTELTVELISEPPVGVLFIAPAYRVDVPSNEAVDCTEARAPPA